MIGLLPCHSIFVEVDDIKRKTELLHHEGMNLGCLSLNTESLKSNFHSIILARD